MQQNNWVVHLIAGIVIAGLFIAGIVFLSFLILPVIALLAVGVPIYLWLRNKKGGRRRRSAGKNEMNVEKSHYDVLDEDEGAPSSGDRGPDFMEGPAEK
ncbi:MAG: hypothetical protein JXQ30_06190 [Spirochaetes bacterium]|nr:hypothetical protein [Spirochaetota bacterium]